MAASPIAAFPVISTLATVHLYGHFRADNGTGRAPGARAGILKDRMQITRGVELVRKRYQFFRAEEDADTASLAQFPVYFYSSFHGSPDILLQREGSPQAKNL